jgi:hypothetical protein
MIIKQYSFDNQIILYYSYIILLNSIKINIIKLTITINQYINNNLIKYHFTILFLSIMY